MNIVSTHRASCACKDRSGRALESSVMFAASQVLSASYGASVAARKCAPYRAVVALGRAGRGEYGANLLRAARDAGMMLDFIALEMGTY